MKTCPNCGAENKSDSAACSNCYSSLDGAPANKTVTVRPKPKPVARRIETPKYQARSSSGGSKTIPMLMVLIVLAGVGFGVYWFVFKTASDRAIREAAQQYITAVENNDLDAAMSCMSSETRAFYDKTGIHSLMKKLLQAFASQQPQADKRGIKVVSCSIIDDTHASVTLSDKLDETANPVMPIMQTGGSFMSPNTIPMIREGETWKVDGMKLIVDSIKALSNEQLRQIAGLFKLMDSFKPMLGESAGGLNMEPISDLVNTELRRRNIDPSKIPPPKVPSILMNKGM